MVFVSGFPAVSWRLAVVAAALAATQASVAIRAAEHQPIGERFRIEANDLPPPYATPSVLNPPRRVPRPVFAGLRVPAGFRANIYANGLRHARWLAVAPNGDVFVAETGAGRITVLGDADRDGVAERRAVFADGLDRPHGMAFHGGHLYVGEPTRVVRFAYQRGAVRAGGPAEPVTLPGALGDGVGHHTRTVVFAADGASFYLTVGSRNDVAEEAAPRGTVQRFAADGSGQTTIATGLRNPIGMALQPTTGALYAVVAERDGLGDGLVPDFLARIDAGGFYGWPYSYLGANPDPRFGAMRPDLLAKARPPEVLFQAHSTPLGFVFYDGAMFPPDYRGDGFVALHGSSNAAKPTGYTVVRVPFQDGRPEGTYETFAAGFWLAGDDRARVWGRPAGLAVAQDGSLLIADDVGNTIWRVHYDGDDAAGQ